MSFASHCYAFQYVLELHYPKRPCNRLLPPRLLICEQLTAVIAVDVSEAHLAKGQRITEAFGSGGAQAHGKFRKMKKKSLRDCKKSIIIMA